MLIIEIMLLLQACKKNILNKERERKRVSESSFQHFILYLNPFMHLEQGNLVWICIVLVHHEWPGFLDK